jgi:hypothetical protein
LPTIWDKIGQSCDEVSLWVPPFFLTKPDREARRWVIGRFCDLKGIAPVLRTDEELREAFSELSARFGQRETDLPPAGERVTRIGPLGDPRFTIAELKRRYARKRRQPGASQPFAARVTDIHPEHKRFWESRTLEVHHIVEKSMLGALGVNAGDLENNVAPCVLAVAEMHQRLYTPEMASERGSFSRQMSASAASNLLTKIYDGLYAGPVMTQLNAIAKIIIEEVRHVLTTKR